MEINGHPSMTERADITKETLRAWRTSRGYSVAHAARKIGAPTSTWLRWETGKTIPSEEYKAKLRRLFEAGDIWADVSDETLHALRLCAISPRLADFSLGGLATVFDEGPKRENKAIEYARTWFEHEFVRRQPKKLAGDEHDIFRQTSFFALCAGYAVAAVKYAPDEAEEDKWGQALDWLFIDLTGLRSRIRNDLWFEAFEANFAAGYALGVDEFCSRLGEETYGFRPMPHTIAGERAVLSSLLMDGKAQPRIIETLSVEDFFVGMHRRIFQAIKDLYLLGEPLNPVSVTAEMKNQGTLEAAGGPTQLKRLAESVPDYREAMDWTRLVKEESMRRQVIATAKAIMRECYGGPGSSGSSINELEHMVSMTKSLRSGLGTESQEPQSE